MPGMVDITGKPFVYREAVAEGFIKLRKKTLDLIRRGGVEKGDVLETARIAATLAVKNTPQAIPLCHPIPITSVNVFFSIEEKGVRVKVIVKTEAQTGVEMEALHGVSVALLTIWDMVKKYEKDEKGQYPYTRIDNIHVLSKLKKES